MTDVCEPDIVASMVTLRINQMPLTREQLYVEGKEYIH